MDIQLPGMSGIDCVARLKELLPSAQFIMVTVYEDPDTIFRALQAGACGYVLKRAPAETILGAIREVQRGGVPMSVEIARKVIGYFQGQGTAAKETENPTSREREVLDLAAHGYANKEIADRLEISIDAVLLHFKHIYQKLQARSQTQPIHKVLPRI
jgi:DNA-binding NarL/FixJ family response regulator